MEITQMPKKKSLLNNLLYVHVGKTLYSHQNGIVTKYLTEENPHDQR